MQHVVILGAGTAGTIMANRLRKTYRADLASGTVRITVIDESAEHVYQPGLLYVPFGLYEPDAIVRPRADTLPKDVTFIRRPIDRVDPDGSAVVLAGGERIAYDVLIIATGTRIVPEETEGLTGPGWNERMFDFYTLDGATKLRDALETFEGGRIVINIVDMPIKCPVAPLEFAFLADWYFTERRRMRDQVEIAFVTPLDGAFTKPRAAATLGHLLDDKDIDLVTEFSTGEVDGQDGRLVSWDEREEAFDLLVTVPLHMGAAFVGRSDGLGDDLDFVLTDPETLRAQRAENIFALGDATNVPTSKAGSVAHFQAEVLTENVRAFLAGRPATARSDGHANCFIETGFRKALLIDFNYTVEPLPGTFPLPRVGPLVLLRETWLNHLGKLAFRWVYWNMLLPGLDIPFVPAPLSMRGKRAVDVPAVAAPHDAGRADDSTRAA
jgi:sulfide:quinone oxidoreductase